MALGELKNGIGPDAYAIYQQVLAAVVERDHPVGSLYISENPTSPAELYGGTWEQIKDSFILAAGDTYAAGSTGGSATHHLTQSEIPNYILMYNMMHCTGRETGGWGAPILQNDSGYIATEYQLETKGGNQPMDILNPYYCMYVWKRVA